MVNVYKILFLLKNQSIMIYKTKISFKALLVLLLFNYKMTAQVQNIEKNQGLKLEQLLIEKRKLNPSLNIEDSYKIQIFSGSNELAKKNLALFRLEFRTLDATIIFNTPNYKVWIGNYKTRMEAERNLIEIRKKFTNALLIKPIR